MSTEGDTVLVEDDGKGMRILTMNRPDKLNALNTRLTQDLCRALGDAESDPSVSAVVLTGSGKAFCAGADVSEFSGFVEDNRAAYARAQLTSRLHMLIQQMSKPVIGAARGVAVGGGAGLAIACDMLVVGEDLRFGYPEVVRGLVPAIVMTSLQRQLGRKLAFELITTGRFLCADEAYRAGIANCVVAPDRVLATAGGIAARWAASNRTALAATKELFYRVADLSYEAAMAAGRDMNLRMRAFPRND